MDQSAPKASFTNGRLRRRGRSFFLCLNHRINDYEKDTDQTSGPKINSYERPWPPRNCKRKGEGKTKCRGDHDKKNILPMRDHAQLALLADIFLITARRLFWHQTLANSQSASGRTRRLIAPAQDHKTCRLSGELPRPTTTHFASATGTYGLAGLTVSVCVAGCSTKSIISIGTAPIKGSSPRTRAERSQ